MKRNLVLSKKAARHGTEAAQIIDPVVPAATDGVSYVCRSRAKPRQPITRSPFAPMYSVEAPDWMRARLLDEGVTLTMDERRHIARDWHPNRKPGRQPALPAARKRGEAKEVARFYIWHAFGGRKPGDDSEEKRARGKTADWFECGDTTVRDRIALAMTLDNGTWWKKACRLACKGKREALMRF